MDGVNGNGSEGKMNEDNRDMIEEEGGVHIRGWL